MESLEFDFMRERRRGFLDIEIPKYSRLPRPLSTIQLLKREVRKLDPLALAVFTGWIYMYDSTSWERELRRERRAGARNRERSNDVGGLC